MKLGFTGTRKGMTKDQEDVFYDLIVGLNNSRGSDTIDQFHHGCCVGADAEAHDMIEENFGMIELVGHPPSNPKHMASLTWPEHSRVMKPYNYLKRNRHIVENTEILIATPKGRHPEHRGSGTWYTIRYARAKYKTIYIIYPDGMIRQE